MTRKNKRRYNRKTGRRRADNKPARTPEEREQHLIQIGDLRLQGWPQYKIAAELGISQSTVSQDLSEVVRRWQQESIKKIEEYKAMECARIDKVLAEAWEAWEKSKKPRQEVTVEKKTDEQGSFDQTSGPGW